jgi:hypothetical protein
MGLGLTSLVFFVFFNLPDIAGNAVIQIPFSYAMGEKRSLGANIKSMAAVRLRLRCLPMEILRLAIEGAIAVRNECRRCWIVLTLLQV